MAKEMIPQTISFRLLGIIFLIIILMQTTTDQYLPSLPEITQFFKSTEAVIQLSLTFFMLGLGFSHLFYGPVSDRVGRKPPLMYGIGISIIGSLICYASPSTELLILGRFLQGFGIGACNSVGRSLARDLFTDKVLAKVGSYVGIISLLIMAASPILGGFIQEQAGWRSNFLFLVLFGLFVWVIAAFALPETNKQLNPQATHLRVMWKNYIQLLSNGVFLGYTLSACFAFAGLVAYFTIAPFLFQDIQGLSPLQFGRLSLFIAGAICLSGVINSVLVMHKGIAFMTRLGASLMIVGGLWLLVDATFHWDQVFGVMIPMSLFSMGAGFTFINAFAGAFHPFPEIAGTVGALYACMQDLSASIMSGFIAGIKAYGSLSLAIILLLLGLGSLKACYHANENNRMLKG
ncbi:multidrug effflux MFS transporter [Legionella waltersii]|uniref:Bcr/CflA family efflux transporter n=1 Tax=Legionella waltersii TaxID=66969 RepID=A0A0W0ZZU6_9GAMM|nr:multidrug effflux MFS transporter [Legionella waltersii]KTD74616.1 multidrug resistance protein D [Legionella waltersii]SNV08823.1 multidrug resistance protein D [Legionella waltersii]